MSNQVFSQRTGLSRRNFLKNGLGGLGVGAALPLLFPNSSQAAQDDQKLPHDSTHQERILVVVELDGGNDGLNTVIPYGDDAYYLSTNDDQQRVVVRLSQFFQA